MMGLKQLSMPKNNHNLIWDFMAEVQHRSPMRETNSQTWATVMPVYFECQKLLHSIDSGAIKVRTEVPQPMMNLFRVEFIQALSWMHNPTESQMIKSMYKVCVEFVEWWNDNKVEEDLEVEV